MGKNDNKKKQSFEATIGSFDSASGLRNGDAAGEASYFIKIAVLQKTDELRDKMDKAKVTPQTFDLLKCYINTPPLTAKQSRYETAEHILDARKSTESGTAKYIGLDTAAGQLCLEALMSKIVYELYLVRNEKSVNDMLSAISRHKSIKTSVVAFICDQKFGKVKEDHGCIAKLNKYFGDIVGNEKVRTHVIYKLLEYFTYLGQFIGKSVSVNKRAVNVNFRGMLEFIELSAFSFGYEFDPVERRHIMEYAEDQLSAVAKAKNARKAVNAGGKKMKEEDRAVGGITKNTKAAKAKKATKAAKAKAAKAKAAKAAKAKKAKAIKAKKNKKDDSDSESSDSDSDSDSSDSNDSSSI